MPRKLVRRMQSSEPGEDPETETDADADADADAEATQPEWKPTPLLYNVADACFILGKISKQMLYRLIHLKQIHPVKIGTRSLFTMAELERFVEEKVRESELAG
jgi:Helix-turn-helix domain